jgi:hypothetical protein
MSSTPHNARRLLACLAVLTPLVAATAARAADRAPTMTTMLVSTPHNPCGQRLIENPFTQWDDTADYFLSRGGDLSGGAQEWSFDGSELVADNNPYSLYPGETAAVALGEGASATAPMVCVGVDDPTMRFFVRNAGSAEGTLRVDVLYEDDSFQMQTLTLGTLTSADAGDEWTPSPSLELAAPLVALLDDDLTPVWFQFTAQGSGSSWVVDDVYVDPYGKG